MYLKKINLNNKTALVTGAGKGIGKACAIALAEAGADLIIISRTKKDLDKVSKIIKYAIIKKTPVALIVKKNVLLYESKEKKVPLAGIDRSYIINQILSQLWTYIE